MLDDFYYGRKDAESAADCGDPTMVTPGSASYADTMRNKGFSDAEIVALAYCEAFGVV